jgi:transposase
MENSLNLISERIDDIVLLLHLMIKIGLPELLNRHLPRHWKQEGLDWGWVAVIWLAYIVSEGDHRKVRVQEWVSQRRYTIEQVCDLEIRPTDFTDDRLSILLRRLSHEKTWAAMEGDLNQNTIRVYALDPETVRLDATTLSGHHLVSEDGLFQFGHSKDDPTLPQVKVMMGVLAPLGLPIATQVVSGEQADDGLYLPAMAQIHAQLSTPHLLFVGDCKLSALSTRSWIAQHEHYYLAPLAATGKTPDLLQSWIETALSGQVALTTVEIASEDGTTVRQVQGYEVQRPLTADVEQQRVDWQERVLVLHSPTLAQQQQQGLEKRLQTASDKLMALTPTPGRGKRQITAETDLLNKANAILQQYRVSPYLSYDYAWQPTGKPRYEIQQVTRHETEIAAQMRRCGWRAYVTNAPGHRLSLTDAVFTYRDQWIVERGFGRLKGCPLAITPLFVQRDDQVKGLIHLLSLALRLLTLIEFVVRRQLQHTHTQLTGLYPEHPKKQTAKPTAERILRAFSNLTLTLVEVGGKQFGHAPPLSPLQQQILPLLGLSQDIYSRLVENSE